MKNIAGGLKVIVCSVLLCFGLPAFGQNISAQGNSVTFTGGYTTTWANNSGDYGAGIYSATINGVTSSSGIICDDFSDNIVTGETWTANAYQASSLASGNLSNTLFGTTGTNPIGITGYAEVATLVSMMFSGSNTYAGVTGTITQAEISSAIWDVTLGGTPTSLQGLDQTAKNLVAAVEAAFSGNTSKAANYLDSLTNLWILVPTSPWPQGQGRPQEMWTQGIPEGGAALMYLLLAGISCFGAMWFSSRNQSGRRVAA
jgi:hypothetical protein